MKKAAAAAIALLMFFTCACGADMSGSETSAPSQTQKAGDVSGEYTANLYFADSETLKLQSSFDLSVNGDGTGTLSTRYSDGGSSDFDITYRKKSASDILVKTGDEGEEESLELMLVPESRTAYPVSYEGDGKKVAWEYDKNYNVSRYAEYDPDDSSDFAVLTLEFEDRRLTKDKIYSVDHKFEYLEEYEYADGAKRGADYSAENWSVKKSYDEDGTLTGWTEADRNSDGSGAIRSYYPDGTMKFYGEYDSSGNDTVHKDFDEDGNVTSWMKTDDSGNWVTVK